MKHVKRRLATALIAGLTACSEPPPPPKPAAPPSPPPKAEAPAPAAPAPSPEAKAPEAPKPDPNKELAQRVKRALEGERKINSGGIDVTAADGGRVSLWGTAATADERNRAGQVASKVEGVTSVENKLAIVKGS